MDGRRLKYTSILVVLAAAGLGMLASTQTWFTVRLTQDTAGGAPVTVQGSVAAPALAALAVAGLALAGALAIAGRIIRGVLAVLGILVGGSIVLSAVTSLADPVLAASPAISKETGVSGARSVAHLVAAVDVGPWPGVALAGGVLLALAAVSLIVTGRRWPAASSRYRPVTLDSSDLARLVADTDRGDGAPLGDGAGEVGQSVVPESAGDPTAENRPGEPGSGVHDPGEHGGGEHGNGEHDRGERRPAENARDQAIDDWDDLTRGDDPTRFDATSVDPPRGDDGSMDPPSTDPPRGDRPDPA